MSDTAYMDAVRRGDMETAQRMVDAAANAAGYTIESFHGTNGDLFTVFDPSRGGEKTGADSAALGIFSTDNSKVAQQYAENYGVGGAMGIAFGSGPLAAARDEALATPDGKRLVQQLEDAKEEFKRAYEKVRKKAMDSVLEQAEKVPEFKRMLSEYGEKAGKSLLEKMAQVAWSNDELYNDKIIVDAEKAQRDAEERLSDYIEPFILERIPNKRIMQLRLKIKNPKIYDAGHKTPAQFSLSDKIQSALEKGYDGVIFNNIIDPIESATHYVVFNSEQIKLANAVTKDDAGRIIPLSQRFNEQSKDIRNPYTRPDLRERLKRKIMAGDRGGLPGQWSARKAQLLAAEYEKAGGGYTGGRSKAQRSLTRWTKQDWRTKSGKPSLETGERYLPAAAIRALSSAEYAASTRAKREATGQFSRQPKRIAMKTKRYRNPRNPQIDTPEFKRWFGKSKVVDANGDPLVVYHGSPDVSQLTAFSKETLGMTTGSKSATRGFFFVDKHSVASQYAGMMNESQRVAAEKLDAQIERLDAARYDARTPEEYQKAEARYQSAVAKQMPLVPEASRAGVHWTDMFGREHQMRYGQGSGVLAVYLSLKNPMIVEQQNASFRDQTYDDLLKEAKRKRHDGLIIRNTDDAPFGGVAPQTIYVAFRPEQIKSAYGNRGTFDPMDPDITNPMTSTVRKKLAPVIEPGDRILCYDTASGEDFYRLWDIIHTAMPMTKEALVEVEGMLDDDGVLVIESGETPAGLQEHFRKATRYNGLLLVQGPKNPENARIETEKLRRELE